MLVNIGNNTGNHTSTTPIKFSIQTHRLLLTNIHYKPVL